MWIFGTFLTLSDIVLAAGSQNAAKWGAGNAEKWSD